MNKALEPKAARQPSRASYMRCSRERMHSLELHGLLLSAIFRHLQSWLVCLFAALHSSNFARSLFPLLYYINFSTEPRSCKLLSM